MDGIAARSTDGCVAETSLPSIEAVACARLIGAVALLAAWLAYSINTEGACPLRIAANVSIAGACPRCVITLAVCATSCTDGVCAVTARPALVANARIRCGAASVGHVAA